MRRVSCWAIGLFLVGGLASMANAEIMLSLSSLNNPMTLPVGRMAMFQVELSGLEGIELDSLAATVSYDETLLGPPTVAKGGIVPLSLYDGDDFMSSEYPDEAGASFYTTGQESQYHVCQNGVFFRFSAPVLKPGMGTLSLSFVDASQYNADRPDRPIFLDPVAGADLSIQGVDVPEPCGWMLLATAATAATVYATRRRKLPSTFATTYSSRSCS